MAEDEVDYFRVTILPKLKEYFQSCVIDEKKSSSKEIVLRTDMCTKDDAEYFKKIFSELTNTEWIVYRNTANLQRFIVSKKWICQHSKRHKRNLELLRNAECKAKLHITVKNVTKDTMKKDIFLRQKTALRCEIKIEMVHTHETNCAKALKMLRVNNEVKECFWEYFSNGMTAAEAKRIHENRYLLMEDFKSLANAAKNPTINQVQHLHLCWREFNLGSVINPFEKLREKIPLYEADGTTVHLKEGDSWAIVLVTPVMKRIQNSQFSKQMIFVDSTTGCEGLSSTMTILLTATKVGALPICVLIHSGQTMENYIEAFNLLKKNFSKCFGGNDHPEIFMTDDSSAEKGALKKVWDKSVQLLCHFHVAQAEWRWLFTHGIPKDERPRLMKLFQAVMYAASEDELDAATSNILKESDRYPEFVTRFKAFYKRKTEWVLCFRRELLTRQNNTNNYAEISIRILKDIVLCRTKAFNVVALCDFCITVWELYLVKRLLDYAYSRKDKVALLYTSLLRQSSNFTGSDIESVNEVTYKIQSGEKSYIIDADIGVCTCPAGISGAFCKHQCFLMHLKKISLPNAPPITPEDRYELAMLALGRTKCPEMAFFGEFKKTEDPNEIISVIPDSFDQEGESSEQVMPTISMASQKQKEMLTNEFARVASLISGKMTSEAADRLLNSLKKIETVNDFKNVYVIKKIGRTKRIKVQPTSISRRQGSVRSSKRLPSGRRPLSSISKKSMKRKRLLSQSIKNNTPNAKSHGIGH